MLIPSRSRTRRVIVGFGAHCADLPILRGRHDVGH